MAIEFDCPNCQTRIRTPDEAAGKKARCPTCQAIVPIPFSSAYSPLSGPVNPGSLGPVSPPAKPPPPAPAPWLPPADAFAPRGPGGADFRRPPGSQNPFGDPAGYASASHGAASEVNPFTKEEVRQKLFGPAVGLALSALLCIGAVVLFGLLLVSDEDFQKDLQNNGNEPEIVIACVVLSVMGLGASLPYFVTLIGAYAMYRGHGLVAAWVGAIAAVLPCNPFFFISAGFAIWGMVVLNDPRVHEGMK